MSSQSNKNTSVFLDGHIDRSTWKRVRLGDVLSYEQPYSYIIKNEEYADVGIPVLTPGKTFILGYTHETDGVCQASRQAPKILFDDFLTISRLIEFDFKVKSSAVKILSPTSDEYNIRYLFYAISQLRFDVVDHQRHWIGQFSKLGITVPTREVQDKIATAIVSCENHIAALKALITKYEVIKKATVNLLLEPHKSIPVVKLGEVADISRGGSPRPIQDYLTSDSNGINWIKIGDVSVDAKYIERTEERIKPTGVAMSRQVKAGDFILSNSMSFGRPYILKIDGCIHDGWLAIQNYQNTFEVDYLYYLLGSDMVFAQYLENAAGSSVKNLNKEIVAKISLPSPPLSAQRRIAKRITTIDEFLIDCKRQLNKAQQLKQGMMSYFFG